MNTNTKPLMRAIEDHELMLISGGGHDKERDWEEDVEEFLAELNDREGGDGNGSLSGSAASYPKPLDYGPPTRVDNAVGGAILALVGYVVGNGPGAAAGLGAAGEIGGEIGQIITNLPDAGRVFIETEMDRALTFHSSAFGRQ